MISFERADVDVFAQLVPCADVKAIFHEPSWYLRYMIHPDGAVDRSVLIIAAQRVQTSVWAFVLARMRSGVSGTVL